MIVPAVCAGAMEPARRRQGFYRNTTGSAVNWEGPISVR